MSGYLSGSRWNFIGLILAIGAILVLFIGLVQWEGGEYSIELFETVQVCRYNGTMEHFYPVYLDPGETITYSLNSSVLTQMGVYYSPNSPAVRSFDKNSPDDYFCYNYDYNSTGTLTITREGYYTISFRATDPSEVFFDMNWMKI